MLEFAMVGPIFFLLLFFVFEVSYDMFLQEVVNSTVAVAARQVQIGAPQTSANAVSPALFNTGYFCPDSLGLLNCNKLFVRVEVLNTLTNNSCADLYQATTGGLPVTGGTLQLGSFTSAGGTGLGTKIADNTTCDSSTNAGTYVDQGYCNPGGQELVIMTGIYVAPSFLLGLVSNTYKYGGVYVRAIMATSAFETESFTASSTRPVQC